jgi:hypothetical protein
MQLLPEMHMHRPCPDLILEREVEKERGRKVPAYSKFNLHHLSFTLYPLAFIL